MECDLIVYSILYRDSLTVDHQMILDGCLAYYTLLKMVAPQTETGLHAHLDEMMKIASERLNGNVQLGSNLDKEIKQSFEAFADTTWMRSELSDLIYCFEIAAESEMLLEALVKDNIAYFLSLNNATAANCSVGSGDHAIKMIEPGNAQALYAKWVESSIQFARPEQTVTAICQEIKIMIQRLRDLSELDQISIQDLDQMSMTDLDFIILED